MNSLKINGRNREIFSIFIWRSVDKNFVYGIINYSQIGGLNKKNEKN